MSLVFRITSVLLFFIYLPDLIISAQSPVQNPDSLRQIGLGEVVISALRLSTGESTVPYSISILKASTNTQGLSLAETLAGLPGLEVDARYNYAVGDRVTNRGFGARTQFGVRGVRLICDEMPVTFADGQTNLEMIDIQNLSYIELLRGPGASLYGNASGGVLLLHTKPSASGKFLSSVSTTMGSNGLFRWNGQLEGRIRKTTVQSEFSNFQYAGFRNHASAQYKRVIVKTNSEISQKDNLQIQAGYVNFSALNPGSLTLQESDQDPDKANPYSLSNAAGQNGEQVQVAGTWKHKWDSISLLKITTYAIHRSVLNPIIGKIVVLPQYSGGTIAAYSSRFLFAGKEIDWNAGTEIATRLNDRKNFTNISGQEGSLLINQAEQVLGSGLFAQAKLSVTRHLTIDACLRYDIDYFGFQNHMLSAGDTNYSGKRIMKALNPSLGMIYSLPAGINCFANVSTSFETPTTTELVNRPDGAGGFNPDLNPSRALEYEAGLRAYINPILKYDFVAYLIRTTNELIPFQVPSAAGQDFYRNAGSTSRKGAEFSLRLIPLSFVNLMYSLTYIDALYKNFVVKGVDYSGNKIPGISQYHQFAEIKLQAHQGLFFSASFQTFGKMYVDDANSASTSPHTVFDLGLGHEDLNFGKNKSLRLNLSGGITNLFDSRYITSVTVNAAANRYYEPGPGRTFYLNARFSFGIH